MRKSLARDRRDLALLGSTCLFAILSSPAWAQSAQSSDADRGSASDVLGEVVVSGYRQSLEDSIDAKRASTNVTDSIFAEDIGKFPDLNIAESLNRIPGVQLTREVNGEGLNIAIRGLGTDFTKVVLNGAQIAVASSGRVDAQNQNRELDLDLFPTELFTRLDVSKTPRASMIEGGVSGIVNMRSARPFDNPGTQFSYQLQGGYGEISEKYSPRGAVTASWTNDTFGVLAGVAAVRNKATTHGFETIGWTNMNVTHGMCGTTPAAGEGLNASAPACNTTGGGGWTPPGVTAADGLGRVPKGAGAGLVEGTVIDRAFLESINPGLTLEEISNVIIPRLGRPAYISGDRDRVSGLLAFEYRPSEKLQFYLDTLYAVADREYDRLDMNFVGRNGASIPMNLEVDENLVIQRGTFANAQFFLEARPYDEEVDFYNINPGVHYDVTDWLGIDFQVNKTRSTFFREAPSILVVTPANQGVVAQIDNTSGPFPRITANIDLNDPNIGWSWGPGSRVNIQNERRVTETEGAHLDLRFGDDRMNIMIGGAFDDVDRRIIAYDNSLAWQQEVCGGGGVHVPPPAPQPDCDGRPGSAVPTANIASYLSPGPAGFITLDFDRFFADTNYHFLSETAPVDDAAATNASSGYIREKTKGAYIEFNGEREMWGHLLRLNAGARYVQTDQTIEGPFVIGGIVQQGPWQRLESDYSKVLPSFNAAFNVTDDVITRVAASRTLTRPNPSSMLPNTRFTDISAQTATQGNPNLQPFISDNIDLAAEWYTGAEGFVGLTLFQKEIIGFTVLGTRTVPFRELGFPFEALQPDQQNAINSRGGPDNATVNLQQQVNADGELRIRGYEVTWVQPLGQWFERLDGLGFNLNYTRVTQKGEGEGAPAQAIGISPHTYNGTLYYEKGGAMIRLSYTWSDDQINSQPNEQGITLAQRFVDAYGQLDLSASYELSMLPTSPQITLNVINITGEEQRSTFQFDNAAFTYYDPGYQILLGIRGKF